MILNNATPEGNETIQNNAVNESEQEPKKGGELPKKLTHRAKELSKLIPVTKIMYSRERTVIVFIRLSTREIKRDSCVFTKLNSEHSGKSG